MGWKRKPLLVRRLGDRGRCRAGLCPLGVLRGTPGVVPGGDTLLGSVVNGGTVQVNGVAGENGGQNGRSWGSQGTKPVTTRSKFNPRE